jgi:hypothetical protein
MSSDVSRNGVSEGDNLLVEAVSLLVRRQREIESWVTEQMCQADARAAASDQRYAALETRLASIEDQLERLVREFEPSRDNGEMDPRLSDLREQVLGLKAGPATPLHAEANHVAPASSATLATESGVSAPAVLAPPGSVPPAPWAASTMPQTAAPSVSQAAAQSVSQAAAPSMSQVTAPMPQTVAPPVSQAMGPTLQAVTPATTPVPQAAAPATTPVPQAAAPVPQAATPATEHVPEATLPPATAQAAPRRQAGGFMDLLGDTQQDRFGLVLIGTGLIAVVYAVLSQLHLG